MLALSIIFLGTVTYSAYGQGVPLECFTKQRDECRDSRLPREFPDTPSKLHDACSKVIESTSCTLKVMEECDPHGNMTKVIREVSEYVQVICDEDSSKYKVLSKNIHCLASVSEQDRHVCRGYPVTGEDTEKLFRETVETHLGDINSFTRTDMYCLTNYLARSCGLLLVNILCGDEADDVMTEIVDKMEEITGYCRPELTAVKGSLRPVFRESMTSDETFMNRIVPFSESTDSRRRRGTRIHLK